MWIDFNSRENKEIHIMLWKRTHSKAVLLILSLTTTSWTCFLPFLPIIPTVWPLNLKAWGLIFHLWPSWGHVSIRKKPFLIWETLFYRKEIDRKMDGSLIPYASFKSIPALVSDFLQHSLTLLVIRNLPPCNQSISKVVTFVVTFLCFHLSATTRKTVEMTFHIYQQ